jgi:hypothetical protein
MVRIRILAASLLAAAGTALHAQGVPPRDSARVTGGATRLLQLISDFQMANSPELSAAVNELLSDTSVHMRMAPKRVATAADSARAADIVVKARAALDKFRDVKEAEKVGYVEFMPWLEDQSMFHYNNIGNVLLTMQSFDATKPVSLLYVKNAKGEKVLTGAMYASPPNATPDDLDARLPLGIAHWHEHVDFCGPKLEDIQSGAQKVDAASTAKWLKITTRADCAAAGGRFVPRLFGWMAHVYLFAGDDPRAIWGGDDRDHMHSHHPPGGGG